MTGPTSGALADGPDGYRIVQTIGHGASSTVYEAVQSSTGRRVALKIVATATPGGDAERLFTRERAVLAEIGEHPHVVSIIDAGEWDGRFWLAMEHCPFGSVAGSGERLEIADVVAVLSGVGSALEAAHRAGLVHCDVKPANILRNRYGSPALADFGIAKFILATGHGSTATGYTLDHASPEAIDGERPTGASDVWSLGTSLWELLEGRPPYRNVGEVAQSAVIRRICFEPTPPLTREDAPEDLATLVQEMTRKSPDERPSVVEVLERARALEAVVGTPDPERWSQTIVSPAVPEHVEQGPEGDAAASVFAGPSVHELTNVRPQAQRPHQAPLLDPVPSPAPRHRPWLIAAAVVLAVVLMGGGGAVTWRMASAASVPVASPAPAPTSTTTTAATTTTAELPPPAPVVPEVEAVEAPETVVAEAPQSDGDADEEKKVQEAPAPEAPKLGSVQIKNSTCLFRGGSSCSSTSTKVSFSIAVTDSEGKPVTDGCTATTALIKTDKKTSSTGGKPCSSKVSFTANGSGDYVVTVTVSWKGNSKAKSFRMIVE